MLVLNHFVSRFWLQCSYLEAQVVQSCKLFASKRIKYGCFGFNYLTYFHRWPTGENVVKCCGKICALWQQEQRFKPNTTKLKLVAQSEALVMYKWANELSLEYMTKKKILTSFAMRTSVSFSNETATSSKIGASFLQSPHQGA